MSKYTPGPWEVVRQKSAVMLENLDIIRDANSRPVAYVGRHTDTRLIAAAPDLLAACKEALLESKNCDYGDPWLPVNTIEKLEAAIRKAEGGDQ